MTNRNSADAAAGGRRRTPLDPYPEPRAGESGGEDNPDWPRYIRTTDIAGPRGLRDDVFASLPPEVFGEGNLSALEDVEERPSQPGGSGPGSVGATGPHASMQHAPPGMQLGPPPSQQPGHVTGSHAKPPKSTGGGATGGSGAAIGVVLLLVAAAAAGAAWFTGLIPHH